MYLYFAFKLRSSFLSVKLVGSKLLPAVFFQKLNTQNCKQFCSGTAQICYRRITTSMLFLGSLLISSAGNSANTGLRVNPVGITFSDGSVQSTAALPPLPGNMTWVVPVGSSFEYDSYYTSPVDAMDQLSDWCELGGVIVPIKARCTMMIAPGVYELGADQKIIMRPQVDM